MEYTDLELYIQIRNGQPYEHPIFADNFKQAFPDVDVNNLPLDQFARFIRVDAPKTDIYEICEGPTYQWSDGIVKDTYVVRPMTDEERAQKDAELETQKAAQKEMEMRRLHYLRTEQCRQNVIDVTDLTGNKLWSECLAAHEAWVMENADPIAPPFPRFPIQDEAGNWVAP